MTLPTGEWTALAWSQIWQVTALAAVVAVVVRLICRRRPHLAYVLWMLIMLKCVTPPLWSSPTGVFSWAQARPESPTAQTSQQAIAVEPRGNAAEIAADAADVRSAAGDVSGNDAAPAPPVSATAVSRLPRPWLSRLADHATALCVGGWLIGALALARLFLRRWFVCRRIVRQSIVADDDVVQSAAAQIGSRLGLQRRVRVAITAEPIGPAIFGWLRPVIVLPEAVAVGKKPHQIEPILAHELVHVRRGDPYWGVFQLAVEALWWFHPLVWWANRELCRAREQCCDEEVVAGLPCRPATYARCLLDVLELTRSWRPAPAILGVRSLNVTCKRLEDIMNRSSRFHAKAPRWTWAVLLLAAMLVLPGRAIVLGQNQPPADNQPQSQQTPAPKEKEAMKTQTIVTGQVVDSAGRPIAQAQVAVVARSRSHSADSLLVDELRLLGLTKTDGEGRFRLTIPRLSSASYFHAHVVAVADGCNIGWKAIGLDVAQPQATVALTPEQTIRGRVVDGHGKPAAGAAVHVTSFGKPLPGDFDGIQCWAPPSQLPFWPRPVVTDREGHFTLRGVDRNGILNVQVRDDRFTIEWMHIGKASEKAAHVTEGPSGELTLAPPPARIFEGRITYEDTRQPVAQARVEIGATFEIPSRCTMGMGGRTDAEGRFRLNPWSGKIFHVSAHPPEGQPYLSYQKEIRLADGQQPARIDIALPRGVLLRGKITEKSSGKPVAGAVVEYEEHSRKPYRPDRILPDYAPPSVRGVTGADGTYQMAVPPGRGSLFVQGSCNDFIRQTITPADFLPDVKRVRLRRHYVGAYGSVDLKPGQGPAELNLSIRRGVTVRGRIVGPDVGPVGDVLILSRHFIGVAEFCFRGGKIAAKDGQFEIHGLDPDASVPFYFLDSRNLLGATAAISGKSADAGPLIVRLQPCGRAVVRYVDRQGKAKGNYSPSLKIVVSPGPFEGDDKQRRKIASDEDFVANFDREHYWDKIVTDNEGRCTFPALIPGATYRIPIFNKLGDWDEKDFTVKPGETLQLPDVTVKTD
jgi:beta-lactamase regulating signal transducer with metallopeptidase domain/protocatechuate 3,4-dioxygenase beta subunit